MESEKGVIKLTRRQLYDEIWELSVAGVARKYNLNYSKLIASCRSEDIPFPSSGYWTRKSLGKDVTGEVVNLSGQEDKKVALLTKGTKATPAKKKESSGTMATTENSQTEQQKKPVSETVQENANSQIVWEESVLDFLPEAERNVVLNSAAMLRINESGHLHKVLVQYKKDIAEYKEKQMHHSGYQRNWAEPDFFNEMSDEGRSRAFAILDALFKTIESLGGSINHDLSMKIRNDVVRIRMAEGQDQIKHELTKEEARELVRYNDAVKNNHWASKPQIRKYDRVYNGKLRIVFAERSYIRDSASEKLEDRLGDILITLYEKSEENRVQREAREEAERKRVEEARKKEKFRQRKEQEICRVQELVNKAEDYRIATEIRNYIQAVMEKTVDDDILEWVKWAKKKADWYDPTVASNDEFFGKRNHGKNREEKDRQLLDSVKKYGYW